MLASKTRNSVVLLTALMHSGGAVYAQSSLPRQRYQARPVTQVAAQTQPPASQTSPEKSETTVDPFVPIAQIPPASGAGPRRLPVIAVSTALNADTSAAQSEYNPPAQTPDSPKAASPELKKALGGNSDGGNGSNGNGKVSKVATSTFSEEPPTEPGVLQKRVETPEKKEFEPTKIEEEKKADDPTPPPTFEQATFPDQEPLFTGKMGPKWDLSDNFYWYDLGTQKKPVDFGGWISMGYTNKSDGVLNTRPDAFNPHQMYLYAEKVAEQKPNDMDWGFRADILYGLDGENTQAYGNNPGRWDYKNGFDHGQFHWAIPQAYLTAAYDKVNVKLGHFYTLHGYEVVPSTGNFFYSHAFTWNFTEPFTHTGAVATYKVDDLNELYAGYVLGWDSGFDRFNGGSSGQLGFKWGPSKDFNLIYMTTAGNNGWIGWGYTHGIVATTLLTDKLTWVLTDDVVQTNKGFLPGGSTKTKTISLVNYLLYQYSETIGVGARAEIWHANGVDYYEATAGFNLKPRGNLTIRPEVRYQWTKNAANPIGLPNNTTILGIDAVYTF